MNPTVVAYVIHALVGEFGLPDQLRFATVLHNNASLFSITSYSLKILDPSQSTTKNARTDLRKPTQFLIEPHI